MKQVRCPSVPGLSSHPGELTARSYASTVIGTWPVPVTPFLGALASPRGSAGLLTGLAMLHRGRNNTGSVGRAQTPRPGRSRPRPSPTELPAPASAPRRQVPTTLTASFVFQPRGLRPGALPIWAHLPRAAPHPPPSRARHLSHRHLLVDRRVQHRPPQTPARRRALSTGAALGRTHDFQSRYVSPDKCRKHPVHRGERGAEGPRGSGPALPATTHAPCHPCPGVPPAPDCEPSTP